MCTVVACNSVLIFAVLPICWQYWSPAGVTQQMQSLCQPVTNRDPCVKDKTFPVPRAVLGGYLFEIFQNAAFEVKDILNTLTQQIIGGFFTSNPPGTKHCNLFIMKSVLVFVPPGRKVAKRGCVGIDCAIKTADGNLIVVAGVDHCDIPGSDQRIPIGGLYIMSDLCLGVDIWLPHCHDLFF